MIKNIIDEAFAAEEYDALNAGTLGYTARALVQATMPHSKPKTFSFVRENGNFSMALLSNPKIGLPYGSIPRIVVSWLTTEAVKTKEREVVLGKSLSEFMREIGMKPTGGSRGDITRLKEQMVRLFSSTITCSYTNSDAKSGKQYITGKNIQVVDEYDMWWSPKDPNAISLFNSTVLLSKSFFDEVTQNPIPIDQRALKFLKKSPMAIDQYCWLTYRMYSLRKPTVIPWQSLQMQFGAEYKRLIDFRAAFKEHLKKVCIVYPEAKVDFAPGGLLLKPSPTHVIQKLSTKKE